ncbi:Ankyrin repeat domain-containing protein 53 [Collichthys lucidus]|uniref:Ankyrin repeat domain-containing protein 53 n=1 Tax=Collichthys lucidus TaxID=240159 RepID=A0A4U5VY54_COLLU|nr:Ankyrin repeat domain-containing protein 53 [Collichthys lucidus]
MHSICRCDDDAVSFPVGNRVSTATMETVNKAGRSTRRRGRRKNCELTHRAPPGGQMFPAVESLEKLDVSVNTQGESALHTACLYGQLATVHLLLESRPGWIDSSDHQGRRPVHMVLTSRSSPNTSKCLRYLLEHGADVNATTDSGTTPLHLAASEGFLDCTEILVRAGADVSSQDNEGHTPLDLARIWCRRKVARFLKNCTWQEDKTKENAGEDAGSGLVQGSCRYETERSR